MSSAPTIVCGSLGLRTALVFHSHTLTLTHTLISHGWLLNSVHRVQIESFSHFKSVEFFSFLGVWWMILIYASSCFAGALVNYFRLYFLFFVGSITFVCISGNNSYEKIMIMNSVSVPTVPILSSDWLNTSTCCHWDVDFNKAKDVLPVTFHHVRQDLAIIFSHGTCIGVSYATTDCDRVSFSHRVALVLLLWVFMRKRSLQREPPANLAIDTDKP